MTDASDQRTGAPASNVEERREFREEFRKRVEQTYDFVPLVPSAFVVACCSL